jgi:tetratricopeptide (TPR) repeat protein
MLEAYLGLLRSLAADQPRMLQISTCLNALETFPLDAQLLLAMGDYLQAHKRLDLATRSFEAAFKFGKVNLETWHLADWHAMAAACYSLALESENRVEEAQRVLEEALAQHPRSPRLRRRLAEVSVNRGLVEAMLADVDSAGRTVRIDPHADSTPPRPVISATASQNKPSVTPGSPPVS